MQERVLIPACRGVGGSTVNADAVHYSCPGTSFPPFYYTPARSLHRLPQCLHVRSHRARMSLEGERGCDGCWARESSCVFISVSSCAFTRRHCALPPTPRGQSSSSSRRRFQPCHAAAQHTRARAHTRTHTQKSRTRTRLHHHPRPRHTHGHAQSGHSSCRGSPHAREADGSDSRRALRAVTPPASRGRSVSPPVGQPASQSQPPGQQLLA